LIEIGFLTVVRSAFGSINSDDFTANQASLRKETKSLNKFLIPMDSASKVGYTMVLGMIAHKSHCNSILRAHLSSF
jgi:hypothetical protein